MAMVHVLLIYPFSGIDAVVHYDNDHESVVSKIKFQIASQKKMKQQKVKPAKGVKKREANKEVKPQKAQKGGLSSQGQKTLLALYLKKVNDKVKNYQHYPHMAKRLKHEGTIIVRVTIESSGSISQVEFLQKTDSSFLNQAVEETFEKIQKFEKIPQELNEQRLQVKIPITYELLKG